MYEQEEFILITNLKRLMKNVGYKALALFIAGTTVAGCSNDTTIYEPPVADGTFVTIKLQGDAKTRAEETGTAAEKAINKLGIYVFNQDGSRDALSPYVEIPAPSGETQFTVPVVSGQGKRVYVVANGASDTIKVSGVYANLETVEKTFSAIVMDKNNSTLATPTDGFMMSGLSAEWNVEAGENSTAAVHLARLVAKIYAPTLDNNATVDFSKATQEEINAVFGAGTKLVPSDSYTLQLTGYAVINGLHKSVLYNTADFITWVEKSYYDDSVTPVVSLYDKATYDANGIFTSSYTGATLLTTTANPYIYAYENKPVRRMNNGVEMSVANTVYAFIVAAKITGTAVADGSITTSAERYWRVNFYKGDIYKVQRNAAYRITVNKVVTLGAGTPEDAENGDGPFVPDPGNSAVNIRIDVLNWNLLSETTQM
jgi:hypothetical protein